MSKETILIVDDEEDIIELIKYNLENEGYSVLTAMTGEQAVEMAQKLSPDLIILDLMLPGMDGLEVTDSLKKFENTRGIPIVMVTAKGDESDIVTGLELGATDYISKPFSPKVMLARIRAVLRRRRDRNNNRDGAGLRGKILKERGITMDRTRRMVFIDEKPVDLTFSEFQLLAFLVEKKGWVFTRDQIVNAVHGENYAVTERSIDVLIVGLRKKLKNYAFLIETVRGVGYRFKE